MTAIVQQKPVARPTRQAPPGSILDCATVIDVDSLWGNYENGFWSSAGCGNSQIIPTPLCTTSGYTVPSKTFPGPTWAHGHIFAVYRAVGCNAVGFDLTTADLEAEFNAAEGRAVAKAISNIYDPIAQDASGGIPAGSSKGAVCQFAQLVGFAQENYGGSPTYLIPAGLAVVMHAGQVLEPTPGGGYTSPTGGCVALAGIIPNSLVLGEVVILRTPLLTREVYNPATNQVSLLTERLYEVGVDCDFAAKVAGITVNCGAVP